MGCKGRKEDGRVKETALNANSWIRSCNAMVTAFQEEQTQVTLLWAINPLLLPFPSLHLVLLLTIGWH